MTTEKNRCPDCQADPGASHKDGCDVARCRHTGQQRLQCDHDDCNTTWTGNWPGEAECSEYGWWTRWDALGGWVSCSADHPEAQPDLNRLQAETTWDSSQQRYIKNSAGSR